MNQTPPDPERLVEDMGIRWGRGERVLVESYLSSDPALRDTPEVLLDLIYQEVVLREQHGETPTLEEYRGRFPELASQLVKQFAVHQFLPNRLSLGALGSDTRADSVTHAHVDSTYHPTEVGGEAIAASPGTESSAKSCRYEILGELARGGMGMVFRAHDGALRREVALKVLGPEAASSPDLRQRFLEEAQISGQLQHPAIPPIHDRGLLPDGRAFLSMKRVKGHTLEKLLAARPEPAADLPRFLGIFETVCQAVAYAHSRGVIHRDLKPLNVMVGAFGEVQVMDWGLAKVLGRSEPAPATPEDGTRIMTLRADDPNSGTKAGKVMGTAAYMPPEQAEGEIDRVDRRADVFALGSILCAILTGQPAYTGRSFEEVSRKARRGDVAEARGRLEACGADPELIALAKECLAPEPVDRPADAGVLAVRIAAYQSAVQERLKAVDRARAAAEVRVVEERKRRLWQLGLAASSLGLIMLAGGIWAYLARERATRLAATAHTVEAALALADQAQGRATALTAPGADIPAWTEALNEARRAEDALRSGEGTSALKSRVAARIADLEDRLAEARQRARDDEVEQKLVERLETIRGQRGQHFEGARSDADYAQAFHDAGLDLDTTDPKQAGDWIKQRRRSTEIIAAVDDWCMIRRMLKSETSDATWRRLNDAAQSADSDSWRQELRSLLGQPSAKVTAALRSKADNTQAASRQPAASLLLLAQMLESSGERERSVAVLRQGWRLHPDDFWLHFELGGSSWDPALNQFTHPDEAIRHYTATIALQPGSAAAHIGLGNALRSQGKLDEAIAEYRQAIRLKPDYALAHNNLGYSLDSQGKLDEAMAEYRLAVRTRPDLAEVHNNVGIVLWKQGRLDEAMAEYRQAIRLKPDYANAHNNLGIALRDHGKPNEAIAEFRQVMRLKPDDAESHCTLGYALGNQGMLDEAMSEYRQAIRLRPDYALAHNNLGSALYSQRKLDEAVAEYRQAIRLKPDYANAHNNLGSALQAQGKYQEALAAYHRAAELAPEGSAVAKDVLVRIRETERMIALDARLPAILKGTDQPKDTTDRLALAQMAYDRAQHAGAARLWAEALTADPKLGDDRQVQHRYNAACAAALAGCGEGKDDPAPDDGAKARLRRQALDWLKDELSAWSKSFESSPPRGRTVVRQTLDHWRQDRDLAGIREPAALARLSEPERADWQKLWSEVEALRARAAVSAP